MRTHLSVLLLACFPLLGGKCDDDPPPGNAHLYAICVPAIQSQEQCPQATPSVQVPANNYVVFGLRYAEEGRYVARNGVYELHFKIAWGQPPSGAMRNGSVVPPMSGSFADPVSGFEVTSFIADRCTIDVETNDTENWSRVHIHQCYAPIIFPGHTGAPGVQPEYIGTMLVWADALPGFISDSIFTEVWAKDQNGVFVRAPRGGLSRIEVQVQ